METRQELVASLLVTVLAVAALAAFPLAWAATAVGILLVLALGLLARSAIRLAGDPARRRAARPRHD